MALEDLERELFSAKPKAKPSRTAERERSGTRAPLDAPSGFREKMRIITRSIVLAAGAVLLVTAIVGGGLYYFFSREASRGITLTLEAPETIMSGVPFDFLVSAENEIDSIARDASITLNLPEGVVALGVLSGSNAAVQESIGDIGGRSVAKKTFQLVVVGQPSEEKEIEASISYASGGSSRFEARETKKLTIGEPAVKVTVDAPERVIGNSSFEFAVNYENLTTYDFSGVTLEIQYPEGFSFESASLPPDSLNNYWKLGALNANSKGTLRIKGTVAATGQASMAFPILASANFFGNDYTILKTSAEVALAPSPLALSVKVNGADQYVAHAGELLTYLIRYENRSGIALADVTLRATLAGEMLNADSVGTQGTVDAGAGTVTWNASNVPALRLLDANATGEVALAVPVKNSFPIRRLSDKNFSVRLTVTAESPTVPSYLSADKTSATALAETKLAGLTLVDAQALYRDAPSGIVNGGTVPPKVGVPTQYTVHWIVKNFSTDVEQATVRAALPPEVAWTGVVKSSADSVPLYDEGTREVTWTIGKIPAAKGVVNAPLEAVFQVSATPTALQAGTFQTILGPSALSATDDWTAVTLSSQDGALTTRLEDDPTVAADQGRVVP